MDTKEVEGLNLHPLPMIKMINTKENVLKLADVTLELTELPNLCLQEIDLETEIVPDLDIY